MDWRQALEVVVAKTGHGRYRTLCADDSPHPDRIQAYRALMVRKASEAKDVQSYPTTAQMAVNAAQSLVAAARDGFRTVDQAEKDRRLEICARCPEFDASQGRCRRCGCVSKLKARVASSSCPIGKW